MLLHPCFFLGSIFSRFQQCLLESVGNRQYIPPPFLTRTRICTMEVQRMIALPIALAHVQSSDHLVSRAILSHYPSTAPFTGDQSHLDARYILRFNAFTSFTTHA